MALATMETPQDPSPGGFHSWHRNLFFSVPMKTDSHFGWELCGLLELADFFRQDIDDGSVAPLGSLNLIQAGREVLVGSQNLSESYESADNQDVHLYRAPTIEHRGEHGYTVFGKNVREIAPSTVDFF